MSEEIKKESQDVVLNSDELEQAAGGHREVDLGLGLRFAFDGEEVKKIKEAYNVDLWPYQLYTYNDLLDLGIGRYNVNFDNANSVRHDLARIGIYKS